MTLPASPNRNQTDQEFIETAHAFLGALPKFEQDMNAMYSGMTSLAGGGANCVPYTYGVQGSTGTAGGTMLALVPNSGSQNVAPYLVVDINTVIGNVAGLLDTYDDSASGVKGHIRLAKVGDPTKWWVGKITAMGSSSNDRTFSIVSAVASSPNPFVAGDKLLMYFDRTGDIGSSGTIVRRSFATADTASLAVDLNAHDIVYISALSQNFTIAAPTGTLTAGRQMMVAVRDNGVSRPIAYNTVYRAGADLPFVTSTNPGKWLYIGFIYNAIDSKWDLMAVSNNI